MNSINQVVISGNLTRDPEVKYTAEKGTAVTTFSLALNRSYKTAAGEWRDEPPSFITCVAWGKTGENLAAQAGKGTGVLVTGRITSRSWDDKATGGKRYATEVVVDEFRVLAGKAGAGAAAPSGQRSQSGAVADDEVPF